MLCLELQGSAYEMGRQHGRQIEDRRPLLVQAMTARLEELRELGTAHPAATQPALEALQELDRPLLEFLGGLAEALTLDHGELLLYTLSSYLKDLHKTRQGGRQPSPGNGGSEAGGHEAGCSVWAVKIAATSGDGSVLLVKNRDYHLDHIPLQILARVAPASGYRYLTVGSAGSPNVFSSGINERGLAVADTHVLSRDLGPGLPRFSLMRELLEHHGDTASGLDYLRSVRHMGGGTIVLADQRGHMAVWESGHEASGVMERREGFVASTNHFTTDGLAGSWVEDEPPALQGNSRARRARLMDALKEADGHIDVAWAQRLMSSHGTPRDALCRHPAGHYAGATGGSADSSTISSSIFLPRVPTPKSGVPALVLAEGQPCQAQWATWRVRA